METIEDFAKSHCYTRNKPHDFGWHEQPDWKEDNTFLYHYEHRDSDLLAQSNAKVIRDTLGDYDDTTVQWQHFSHWAVGWIDAVAIKIRDEAGEFTAAFIDMYNLLERLDDYPVLDEDDYSQRQWKEAGDYWRKYCDHADRVAICKELGISARYARYTKNPPEEIEDYCLEHCEG